MYKNNSFIILNSLKTISKVSRITSKNSDVMMNHFYKKKFNMFVRKNDLTKFAYLKIYRHRSENSFVSDHQNNYVRNSNMMNNVAKSFDSF